MDARPRSSVVSTLLPQWVGQAIMDIDINTKDYDRLTFAMTELNAINEHDARNHGVFEELVRAKFLCTRRLATASKRRLEEEATSVQKEEEDITKSIQKEESIQKLTREELRQKRMEFFMSSAKVK